MQGNPRALAERVHDWGGRVFHDVTSVRFAEKAIAAGVDGLICIGAGGGGHSGTTSHLVLIPKIRSIFDGVIVMAGAVTDGAAIRAAEILGADLSYLGTRFIGTRESLAHADYKVLLVSQSSEGLMYTGRIAGVPANWLIESMRSVGLDPDDLPVPGRPGMTHEHLPEGVKPWANLWSAGQGIDLIDDIPSVAELVLDFAASMSRHVGPRIWPRWPGWPRARRPLIAKPPTSCTDLNLTMYSTVWEQRSSEMSIIECTLGLGGGTRCGR